MYKFTLAIRYLLKRRITCFAVLAVALCVFIVLVVMTVMAGLVGDFKEKNHLFVGDCIVATESLVGFAHYEEFMETLEKADYVEAFSPAVKSFGLIGLRGSSQKDGVEIMGIDPVMHSRATGFGQTLVYHKEDVSKAFELGYDPTLIGCVLGVDMVDRRDPNGSYSVGAGLGRSGYSISCFPLTPKGATAGTRTDIINTKTLYHSDTSISGLARVDESMVYLPFEWAQRLCGMADPNRAFNRANAIHIKFKPEIGLQDGCDKIASLWQSFRQGKAGAPQAFLLDTVTVRSWKDYRRASIAPMEKEQTVMTVMFGFVGITTVFIVFVVSYMIISHKSKDIGILKSIGVSTGDIIQLFSVFGFLVGLLGSGIGLFTGWLFLAKINVIEDWLFKHFMWQLWDRTIYAIGDIPHRIEPEVVATIFISAIVACLVGVLVPSWQAARRKPVETLQVNQL